MPIHDWEIALFDDMVQTEFDLRVLCMCGRPPVRCTHGSQRYVMLADALYDIEALQRIYLAQGMAEELEQILESAANGDPGAETPNPDEPPPAEAELVSPQQGFRNQQYMAFWPLLRDVVLAEARTPLPHAFELRHLAPRMAMLAPDLFLLDEEPQAVAERVLQQLIGEGKLNHLSSDARRRIVVVCGTPESILYARQSVLPRWKPAMRSALVNGRRRGRKA